MCLTLKLRLIGFLAILACCPTLFSQVTRNPQGRLFQQYESDSAEWSSRFEAPATEDDWIAKYRDWPGWQYAPEFVRMAQNTGDNQVAFEALTQVVQMGDKVSEADVQLLPHYENALKLLLRDHLDKDLRPICVSVSDGMTAGSENFLRQLLKAQTSHEVRAEACYSLGRLLAKKRLLSLPESRLQQPAKSAHQDYINRRCRPALLRFIANSNEVALSNEAAKYFQRAISQYSDVPTLEGDETLGEAATHALYELEHLSPGRSAPNIKGVDLNNRPLSLREYRGKVVVLVFWASWCAPCMGDIPHEKELVEHFAGRPFAIVGVNADQTPNSAASAVAKHRVPWRSFWDGKDGPVSKAWNVSTWPAVYVLDHRGVIRHKDLRREYLDDPLEQLVTAAEEARAAQAGK